MIPVCAPGAYSARRRVSTRFWKSRSLWRYSSAAESDQECASQMPQFIRGGPVVPDNLVQDLEDDRVVIFCGAGISKGAGLPDYVGLVKHCYRELTEALPEDGHSDWNWPDRMLGALESRYSSERVRDIVTKRLSRRPRALGLHRAILRLARLRRLDGIRLVTTNFDTYFESARRKLGLRYDLHAGPVVPIPRNDRAATWRSLVYLHGRLGTLPRGQLVLTSADFGRAYLTDGWAARFVARLFADFTVLFIGYSLNDPVMRYMVDAFAAEDAEVRFGLPRRSAYIFTAYDELSAPDPQPFRDRNLEPIFYSSAQAHVSLRDTVIAWAEARDDYLANVARLISDIAPSRPDAIDPAATANLLWAVARRRGDDGYGARVFADVNDVPPIEWLDAFEANEAALQAAHESASAAAEQVGRLSPPPPGLDIAPLFPLALDARDLLLTPVGSALIAWLVRHLANEGLIQRVLKKLASGRRPHAQRRHAIRQELATNHGLLEGYQRFWRIVASEGGWIAVGARKLMGPAAVVRTSITQDVGHLWLRQELLAGLQPLLKLSSSSYQYYLDAMGSTAVDAPVGNRLSEIARAEVILADGDQIRSAVGAIDARPDADSYWASLLDELTSLLARALRLFAIAGEASEFSDPSAVHRPSIVPHAQNHRHQQWTLLFDLLWRGWTHIDAQDRELSRTIVARWRQIPYLSFRRLVLAAMNQSAHFTAEERLEALLDG
jgi:hypothetical protein